MKNKHGFTLIELLVVVALIGFLAAVVVASLNLAKSKGSDSAVKQDLSSIRTQANLYYVGTGVNTYGATGSSCVAGMFSVDTNIANAITHATANSTAIACNVGPTNQTFAVAATLKASGAGYYCVDSTNIGKSISTTVATSGLVGAGATYALDTNTGLCI
jgi:general secretion pathway protein G